MYTESRINIQSYAQENRLWFSKTSFRMLFGFEENKSLSVHQQLCQSNSKQLLQLIKKTLQFYCYGCMKWKPFLKNLFLCFDFRFIYCFLLQQVQRTFFLKKSSISIYTGGGIGSRIAVRFLSQQLRVSSGSNHVAFIIREGGLMFLFSVASYSAIILQFSSDYFKFNFPQKS